MIFLNNRECKMIVKNVLHNTPTLEYDCTHYTHPDYALADMKVFHECYIQKKSIETVGRLPIFLP